jgi:hypothetical protein
MVPNRREPSVNPSCPAYDASQGSGARRQAPSYRGSGAPKHYASGVALLATPMIGSRMGRDTRRQVSSASRGWVAPRPARQVLEPTSFTSKKAPEGSPRGGQSMPTQPNMQSVRTEQLDDAQGFIGSMIPP